MKINKKLINLIGILIIGLLWVILSQNNAFFPPILQVFYQFCTNLVNKLVISSFLCTILRGFLAFLISLLLGYILAYISYKSAVFKELISPLISFLRSIPTISVIIIVIMIVDLKLISYTIVSLIIFPMIYQNLLYSFENIDNELLMINKIDNINPIKNFFLFIFPITLPGLLNAIIQTLGLSIKIQIMSEILTGSTKIKGIGLLLNNYRTNLEIENVFALTLMIILFVYIIELLVKKIKNLIKY